MRTPHLFALLSLGLAGAVQAQAGSYGLVELTPRRQSGGATLTLKDSGTYTLVSRFGGQLTTEEGKYLVIGDSIFFHPDNGGPWGGRRSGNDLNTLQFQGIDRARMTFRRNAPAVQFAAAPDGLIEINDANVKFLTAMKSDLRTLSSLEDRYYREHSGFAASADSLKLRSSAGVSVPFITVGKNSFSARVTHAQIKGLTCAVAVGTPNPINPFAPEGTPACGTLP